MPPLLPPFASQGHARASMLWMRETLGFTRERSPPTSFPCDAPRPGIASHLWCETFTLTLLHPRARFYRTLRFWRPHAIALQDRKPSVVTGGLTSAHAVVSEAQYQTSSWRCSSAWALRLDRKRTCKSAIVGVLVRWYLVLYSPCCLCLPARTSPVSRLCLSTSSPGSPPFCRALFM
jgi:hypothetical protein